MNNLEKMFTEEFTKRGYLLENTYSEHGTEYFIFTKSLSRITVKAMLGDYFFEISVNVVIPNRYGTNPVGRVAIGDMTFGQLKAKLDVYETALLEKARSLGEL